MPIASFIAVYTPPDVIRFSEPEVGVVSTGEIRFEFSWIYDYWQYNPISNKYLHLSLNVSENDENPVTSGAVYNAIQSAIGTALGGSY